MVDEFVDVVGRCRVDDRHEYLVEQSIVFGVIQHEIDKIRSIDVVAKQICATFQHSAVLDLDFDYHHVIILGTYLKLSPIFDNSCSSKGAICLQATV
ncbi:hypothetical protein BLA29_006119 [Euroglyphus maynei]|uniref:Uncharacterized protein n=1 Tax=Euroglyphus maynei TaxID=6958 RepID=A0A1Y3BUA2_EURMA|nr:hypothetical protein BLA29_006119 [Euroglyphus maynei]